MTVSVGDFKSVLSLGNGHDSGEVPSPTEAMTFGQWEGFDSIAEQYRVSYAVQIDITDQSTSSDAAEGLYSGFFRWVTGRPEYDGVTVIPTGENEGDVWKEAKVIGKGQFGSVDRILDIITTGDYGSLSGFNFAISNADKFHDYLDTNEYFLINRNIKFYIVLDDVFYQVWGGKISETLYDEKVYQFKCEDIFKSVHRPIPPVKVNDVLFPDVTPKSVGKTVPVVFGDVLRSPIIPVTNRSEISTFTQLGKVIDTIPAFEITTALKNGIKYIALRMRTGNVSYPLDYFLNTGTHYLRVVRGEEQVIRIVGNFATVDGGGGFSGLNTTLVLDKRLDGISFADFNSDASYPPGVDPTTIDESKIWWFQIIKADSRYVASTNNLNLIPIELGSGNLASYDADKDDYFDIGEVLAEADDNATNSLGYPNLKIHDNKLLLDGAFKRVIGFIPINAEVVDTSNVGNPDDLADNIFKLFDRDRGTFMLVDLGVGGGYIDIKIQFPEDVVIDGFDKLFIAPDIYIRDSGVGADGDYEVKYNIKAEEPFEKHTYLTQKSSTYYEVFDDLSDQKVMLVPNEYYEPDGNADGEESQFSEYDSVSDQYGSDLIEVPASIVSSFNDVQSAPFFILRVELDPTGGTGPRAQDLEFRQLAFIATKDLDVKQNSVFQKIKGEEVSGNLTDNVYRSFQHMLESYDQIPSAQVDYGNLTTQRNTWDVGRTLVEQEQSSVYLKQLAQQSFVGLYPTRKGFRGLKAFRDDTVVARTFTNTNNGIIAGSITRFEDSPISKVYNDFTINFDWDPGRKKFNRTLFITNTEDTGGFPDSIESTGTDSNPGLTSVTIQQNGLDLEALITLVSVPVSVGDFISLTGSSDSVNFMYAEVSNIDGLVVTATIKTNELGSLDGTTSSSGTVTAHATGIRKWHTYVGGIADYATAKEYWDICHNSFLRTRTVRKLPSSLGDCFWFNDRSVFNGGPETVGTAAHKYLENLLSWTTRQKKNVQFRTYLNPANVQLDILTVIRFKDDFFTDGEFLTGYITRITFDPGKDQFILEAVLVPEDIEIVGAPDGLIIETGSGEIITESGSQLDIITETGVS